MLIPCHARQNAACLDYIVNKIWIYVTRHFIQPELLVLSRDGGATIAYRKMIGKSPTVICCGGYHSDLSRRKALAPSHVG